MAVDKRCLACDTYRDECTGRDEACVDWTPINWDRTVPGSTKEVPGVELIPSPLVHVSTAAKESVKTVPVLKQTETRREKFARIGKKRQGQALEAIRKLEHLTSRYKRKGDGVTAYTYEWTADEAMELVKPITEALANLQAELICCDIPYEHGRINNDG